MSRLDSKSHIAVDLDDNIPCFLFKYHVHIQDDHILIAKGTLPEPNIALQGE